MALRTTRQMVELLSTGDSGKTRVTRQTAAVLAAGVGKMRVYRQMIEVLASEPAAEVYEVSANNALSVTQTLHVTPMQLAASNSLTPSGTATRELSKQRSAVSVLTLTQDADIKNEAVSTIEITHSVAVLRVANKVCISALSPSQTLARTLTYKRAGTSPVALAQEAIYHGPITVSTSTSIALTQQARKCDTLLASANSAISPVQVAVASGTIRVSASNALSLLSLADRGTFNRSASSELVLSQEASSDRRYTAFSTLELTSTAIQGQIFAKATSALSLTQTARSNPLTAGPGPEYDFLLPPTVIDLQQHVKISIHMLAAESALALTDALGVKRPWYLNAESRIQTVAQVFDPVTCTLVDTITGLNDSAIATKEIVTPFVVRQYLQLLGQASAVRVKVGATSVSAANTLSLDHHAFRNRTGLAVSHFDLLVTASGDRCAPFGSVIELSGQALQTHVALREAHSHLGLGHSLIFSIIRVPVPRRTSDPRLHTYCPAVGEGLPDSPEPPPSTLAGPAPGATAPFQLRFPASGSATDIVTVRTPNFGNKDRLSFNRVLRETRGGTLIVYADPIWPKVQTLILSFSGLKASEKDDLLRFLDDHLGLEIGLLDWEHRYWKGVVVVADDPAVQDDRNSFSVSFEFEGELIPGWSP